ncbi:MAG: mRNA surveillance protein pelota [Thermoplasmata archaeon]
MIIEELDERENYIKIRITNYDDLWFLYNFLENGDKIKGYIFRKEESREDSIRSKKQERVKYHVTLEFKEVEFQELQLRLRIRGVIVSGPEDLLNSNQTMNLSINDEIEIIKNSMDRFFLEEIKKYDDSEKKEAVFIAIDDEYATIGHINNNRIKIISEIRLNRQSKDFNEKAEDNYGEIISFLQNIDDKKSMIILLGPGFWKEKLFELLDDELKKRTIIVDTSYAGETGINEAMRSGLLKKLLEKFRVEMESNLINEFLTEIGKEGFYAYGMEEIKKASEYGAIKKLLVIDRLIRDENIKNIMKSAEMSGAEIHIINSKTDYGKILNNLGGIGAILRFRID